jgi:hypothetical protein
MAVPYTFGSATSSIPLSQLDSNFATGITLGNTTVYLGNTTTSFGNVSLTNVTISSVSTAITPAQGGTGLVTIPANNVILGNGTSNVTVVAPGTSGNVLTSNGTTWSSSTISAASVSAAGSTTQVQYNNGGAFAGSANLTFNGTTLTAAGLAGPFNGTVGATTPSTGSFTTLAASSTVSGTGFSTYLASPPAIGGTAAAAGTFTTLTTSSTITDNGGTANGVTYLNGSKVLTSGSALTFDGTTFLHTGQSSFATSTGNVMVGSGTTDSKLRVIDAAGNGLRIGFLSGSSNLNLYDATSHIFRNAGGTGEFATLNTTGLGIGTSSPAYKLDVTGGLITANLRYNTVGTGNTALLRFSVNNNFDGLSLAAIGALSENLNTTATSLVMQTEAAGGAGLVERARISSDGTFRVKGAGTAGSTDAFQVSGSAPASAMALDSSGNLGLGITSPVARFHAKAAVTGTYTTSTAQLVASVQNEPASLGSGVNSSFLRLQTSPDGGNSNPIAQIGVVAESYATNLGAFAIQTRDASGISEKARIDSSGNLGLGVTPSAFSGITALQVKNASMYGSGNEGGIYANAYYNAGWKYIATATATGYDTNALAGGHRWYTAPSGTAGNAITFTQAMTLDASGNLGLAETSPSAYGGFVTKYAGIGLHANSTSGASGLNLYEGGTGRFSLRTLNGSAGLSFYDSFNGAERARIDSSGNFGVGCTPSTKFQVKTGTNQNFNVFGPNTFSNGNTLACTTDGFGAYVEMEQRASTFAWHNGTSEWMRLTGGDLLVGTTSTPGINVKGCALQGFSNQGRLAIGATVSNADLAYFYSSTALAGAINVNGSVCLYSSFSDQRLKENIQDADSASSLIDSLQVRKFDWKADGNHQRYGFVAQELVTIAPEAVHQPTDLNEMMAVDYSKLVPMLVKEIQSLRKRLADAGI